METEYRVIAGGDVPALIALRSATRENALTRDRLEDMGITEASVCRMLESSHSGWLCSVGDKVAGFAIGNGESGEMWVIAVLPEYEAGGIGAELLRRVEKWLWATGWEEIWLTTDIDVTLRAYGFYKNCGWEDWKIENGLRYMIKTRPAGDPPSNPS